MSDIKNIAVQASLAYSEKNYEECEKLCAEALVAEPKNAEMLMLRAKSVGEQTAITNKKFAEAAELFAAACIAVGEEQHEIYVSEAEKSMEGYSSVMLSQRGKAFAEAPDVDGAKNFLLNIESIKKAAKLLKENSQNEATGAQLKNSAANSSFKIISEIWKNIIFEEYEHGEEYPDDAAWRKYVDRTSYCIGLLEKILDLWEIPTTEKVECSQLIMKLHSACIDSCGWIYDMHGSNANVSNTMGKSWHKSKALSNKEVVERKKKIDACQENISEYRKVISCNELEEKERVQKEYWAAHPDEYEEYLKAQKENEKLYAEFIKEGEQHLAANEKLKAALAFWKGHDFQRSRSVFDFSTLIGAGQSHTVAVAADGSVLVAGDGLDASGKNTGVRNVKKWNDIVGVSASSFTTIGVRSNGGVRTAGSNGSGQCDTANWANIVCVSAAPKHTVGLMSDGKAVAVGNNKNSQCRVYGWEHIVAVSAGVFHTLMLRDDGKVLACGASNLGRCDTNNWENIVAVAAGGGHSVGLRSDGTVVACGQDDEGQCNVESWRDIVAIAAGKLHTVGVKADGTVVAVGANDRGQCNVQQWTDVIAVACGTHTVALRADGSVVAAGDNAHGQNNTQKWNLFDEEAAERGKYRLEKLQPHYDKLEALTEQRKKLGVFAFKERKRLAEEIIALTEQIDKMKL